MIDQIIEFNIMSPLLGDGYKAGGIETIKTHPLVPKDIVVRGFIIDSPEVFNRALLALADQFLSQLARLL